MAFCLWVVEKAARVASAGLKALLCSRKDAVVVVAVGRARASAVRARGEDIVGGGGVERGERERRD